MGPSEANQVTAEQNGVRSWWDWRLFARWVLVNALAYMVIVVGGVFLEELASSANRDLAQSAKWLAVLIIAVIGGGFHGIVLGRWQWRVLRQRLPRLEAKLWVKATLVPAFFVWLLAIAPHVVDTLAQGGDTLSAFKNGFIQALVLGPLIGLAQATAMRSFSRRWGWWFAANVTTYLSGVVMYHVGAWLLDRLSLTGDLTPAFPLFAFMIHGAWMLWVTAPEAAIKTPQKSSEA